MYYQVPEVIHTIAKSVLMLFKKDVTEHRYKSWHNRWDLPAWTFNELLLFRNETILAWNSCLQNQVVSAKLYIIHYTEIHVFLYP